MPCHDQVCILMHPMRVPLQHGARMPPHRRRPNAGGWALRLLERAVSDAWGNGVVIDAVSCDASEGPREGSAARRSGGIAGPRGAARRWLRQMAPSAPQPPPPYRDPRPSATLPTCFGVLTSSPALSTPLSYQPQEAVFNGMVIASINEFFRAQQGRKYCLATASTAQSTVVDLSKCPTDGQQTFPVNQGPYQQQGGLSPSPPSDSPSNFTYILTAVTFLFDTAESAATQYNCRVL